MMLGKGSVGKTDFQGGGHTPPPLNKALFQVGTCAKHGMSTDLASAASLVNCREDFLFVLTLCSTG